MAADDVRAPSAEVAVGAPLNGHRRGRRSGAVPPRRVRPPGSAAPRRLRVRSSRTRERATSAPNCDERTLVPARRRTARPDPLRGLARGPTPELAPARCWHRFRRSIKDGETIEQRPGRPEPTPARRRQPRPDPRARRPREQPQGHQRRDPEAPADRLHRRVRLGQELAGVRHDRRRVAADDQRDLQRVRAGLHADTGAAGGRPPRRPDHRDHRRPGADGRQPALHRRHRHRRQRDAAASCSAGSASRTSARPTRTRSTSRR